MGGFSCIAPSCSPPPPSTTTTATPPPKNTQAMLVRGFQGPEDHRLYMMKVNQTSVLANVCALALLAGLGLLIYYYK